MTDDRIADSLARIAAALDRMSPPAPVAADPRNAPAYLWHQGVLVPARAFNPLPLDMLTGIDAQKATVYENARRLAAGHAAHDVLLWGSRGTGKSALVKSVVGALQAEGANIALIAVERLDTLPGLFGAIESVDRAFILFVDDIAFEGNDDNARVLRSLLDGGPEARPSNARLHVTSNRRHIVARDMVEQESAINRRDVLDDRLALADRFGLSVGFHNIDQDAYLRMIESYTARFGLPFDAAEAVQWATQRGSRSGRVAWQYVTELAGRANKEL